MSRCTNWYLKSGFLTMRTRWVVSFTSNVEICTVWKEQLIIPPAIFNFITLILWLSKICQKVWARKVSHCDNVESHNSSYRSWPARWWTTLQTPGSRSTTGSFSTSIQKLPLSCWRTHLIHCRFRSLHCLASWVTSSDSLTNALWTWLMLPWLMRMLTQKPLIMLRKALVIWYLAMIPHTLLSLSLTILTNRKVTSRTSRSLLATQKMKECTL